MSRLTPYPQSDSVYDVLSTLFKPMRPWKEEDVAPLAVDVTETDQAYIVKTDVPGFAKEDIIVEVDGNTVTISAHKEKLNEQRAEGRTVRRERFWGEARRVLTLAGLVDDTAATAVCENGVLTLTLPKRAPSEAGRIRIE